MVRNTNEALVSILFSRMDMANNNVDFGDHL